MAFAYKFLPSPSELVIDFVKRPELQLHQWGFQTEDMSATKAENITVTQFRFTSFQM